MSSAAIGIPVLCVVLREGEKLVVLVRPRDLGVRPFHNVPREARFQSGIMRPVSLCAGWTRSIDERLCKAGNRIRCPITVVNLGVSTSALG